MRTKKQNINLIISILLVLNIGLTIAKLFAGFIGNSLTLIGDGLNSLGDVFTTLLLLIVMKIASKKADKDHPYGHEKYEGVVHFVIGLVVFATAIIIIKSAVDNLIHYFEYQGVIEEPSLLTIIVASIAIVIKLVMVTLARIGAKKYSSVSLKAASIDYLSDLVITTVGLIGIIIARSGFVYFDAIASILIAVIIIKAAFDILKESIAFLVDQAPSDKVIIPIKDFIESFAGVVEIDELIVTMHMNRLYVDVEIAVNKNLSLIESHEIAEGVHEGVEKHFEDVIHCMVHVNPYIKEITKEN